MMFSLGQILLFIMMFLVVFLAKTLGQKLTEKTEKLEAVRKWGIRVTELHSMGDGLRMHFDELWKILEAEG